jgi:chromosome segregation ATPase
VQRKHNDNICSKNSTDWKNDDAGKKEAAVREYRAAAKAFSDKSEVVEKKKAALDQERARLDSQATSLKMDLASIMSSDDFQQGQVQSFLRQRDDAVRDARRLSTMTSAADSSLKSLKSTIASLSQSLADMKAQENAVMAHAQDSTGQILSIIDSEGREKAQDKTTVMSFEDLIEDRSGSLEALSSRIEELSSAVAEVSQRRNETFRKVEALVGKRASLERERTRLQREAAALDVEIGRQEAALDRATLDKHKAQALASRLQSDQMELDQQANAGSRQISMMEEEKASLEETLTKNREALSGMAGSISALSERRASLEHELKSLANASIALHENEATLAAAHAELSANASVVAEHLAALKGQLSAALVSVKESERDAELFRSQADDESIVGKAVHARVSSLNHHSMMRHASHVKAMAEGLMGQCDCEEESCSASCSASDAPVELDTSALDALGAEDGDPRVGMDSEITSALSKASTAIDHVAAGHMSKEEASAVGRATQMLEQADSMLSSTKDALLAAAKAHGVELSEQDSHPILVSGKDLTNQEAIALAGETEARAGASRDAAQNLLDQEAGDVAAANAQNEITESLKSAGLPEERTPEVIAADAFDESSPRFRQRRISNQGTLRAGRASRQVVSSTTPSASKASSAPAASKAPAASSAPAASKAPAASGIPAASSGAATQQSPATSPSPLPSPSSLPVYEWSTGCKKYVAATKRWNAAAADLTSAVHLTEVSRVKYERIMEQVKVSEAARDASRAVVQDVSERVSNATMKLNAAKVRVEALRAQIAKVQASMGEAVRGLTSAQTQVQNLEFDKDDVTERVSVERKVLNRAQAQDARIQSQLNVEQEHLDTLRKESQDRISALKEKLATLEADLAARQQRIQQLLQERDAALAGVEAAESEEQRLEEAIKTDEEEVEDEHSSHDIKSTEHDKLVSKVNEVSEAHRRAQEAAKAAEASIESAKATMETNRGRIRAVRGELERAKGQMHSTNGKHALDVTSEFSLDIAVRQLQDKVESRKMDLDALKTRLSNLVGEMSAFELSSKRGKEAAKELEGELVKEEERRRVAAQIAEEERKTLAKTKTEKEVEQATLDSLAKARNMVPPGAAQQLEEASHKRAELEAAVGGARGEDAAKLVEEPFVSPALAEPGALVKDEAKVDPAVEEALAKTEPSSPIQAEPIPEIHIEEPEVDMEPQSQADADSAALDKVEEQATVTPDQLPGVTGDPSTDALLGTAEPVEAEPVDSIQPPPFAGGPSVQSIPPPPMP